jgi:hypothetical protein
MRYGLIAFLIFFISVGEISSLNISSASGIKSKKDFEFSKTILIRRIEFKNGFLKMPLDSYKTKKYSNIKILTKDFYNKILNCFNIEKCAKSGERKNISIKLDKIFPLKSPLRVANANVSFDDDIIVVFGIVKEKKERKKIWISYPKDFEILDEVFKDNLEKLIKREFEKSQKGKKK